MNTTMTVGDTATEVGRRRKPANKATKTQRAQGADSRQQASRPVIVRARVRRSGCGEAFVRTARPRDESELGERIFVSDGASMLFWRNRTYRLYW
jgi:hypothetical protein